MFWNEHVIAFIVSGLFPWHQPTEHGSRRSVMAMPCVVLAATPPRTRAFPSRPAFRRPLSVALTLRCGSLGWTLQEDMRLHAHRVTPLCPHPGRRGEPSAHSKRKLRCLGNAILAIPEKPQTPNQSKRKQVPRSSSLAFKDFFKCTTGSS